MPHPLRAIHHYAYPISSFSLTPPYYYCWAPVGTPTSSDGYFLCCLYRCFLRTLLLFTEKKEDEEKRKKGEEEEKARVVVVVLVVKRTNNNIFCNV